MGIRRKSSTTPTRPPRTTRRSGGRAGGVERQGHDREGEMISDRTLRVIVDDLAERFILDPSEVPPSMSGFAAEVRRVLDVLAGDELRDKDELTRLGEAKDWAMR